MSIPDRKGGSVHLQASSLGRRFGDHVLFWHLEFDLKGGQSMLIAGPNGSGKSTLIRVMAGVLRPSHGSVSLRIDGRELQQMERPLHCGLVAPYAGLYGGLTARENLAFIAQARQLRDSEALTDKWLERVHLDGAGQKLVSAFSSGMLQRLKLAAACISNPPVLLFDEPWSNLDEPGRKLVQELASTYQSQGKAVAIASNDPLLKSKSYDHRIEVTQYRPELRE